MMRKSAQCVALLAAAVLTGTGCKAGDPQAGLLDPRADDLLIAMGRTLADARQFTFRADTTSDEQLTTGQFIQVSSRRRFSVRRPDCIYVESEGDLTSRRSWYLGNSLTVLDKRGNRYSVAKVPDNIDQTLDFLVEEYDLTLPLADLFFADPYDAMIAAVESGHYIGRTEVDGRPCHHLAFSQEGIDWQIWIDADGTPVPRKLVITFKTVSGWPQFTAWLRDWNLSAVITDEAFKPQLPPDAERVEMRELVSKR